MSKAASLSISTTAIEVRVKAPRWHVDENPIIGDDGEKASTEKSDATQANSKYFVYWIMIGSRCIALMEAALVDC